MTVSWPTPLIMMASASLFLPLDDSLDPDMSTTSISSSGQQRSATIFVMGPLVSAPGPSAFLFLREAMSRWSFSRKICMDLRDLYVALSSSIQGPAFCTTWRPREFGRNFCEPSTFLYRACICEFHRAVRSATELRLSRLLRVGEKPGPRSAESGLFSDDEVRSAVVLVFSSDMRFFRDLISALSFSASLLILMNCVRFWYTFACRSDEARLFSFRSVSSYSRISSSVASLSICETYWSATSFGSRRIFMSTEMGPAPLEGGGRCCLRSLAVS